jgi:hypothetical protein
MNSSYELDSNLHEINLITLFPKFHSLNSIIAKTKTNSPLYLYVTSINFKYILILIKTNSNFNVPIFAPHPTPILINSY